MAIRPVFRSINHSPYYSEEMTEFVYYSGFAEVQKQRCIRSLHASYLENHPDAKLLEISTKSADALGAALSAFSLATSTPFGGHASLESVFQGSKVFENGGPYTDLYESPPWVAKKDPRLKESGGIIAFQLGDRSFPTEPKTFFYDWLYINAVYENYELRSRICDYDGFTDIEFNPQKSLNCQARSAAIYVSLNRAGLLNEAISSPDDFCRIVYGNIADAEIVEEEQMSFF